MLTIESPVPGETARVRAVPAREGRLDLPSPSGRGAGGEGCEKAPKIKLPAFDIRQLLAKPEQVNAFLAAHAPPVLDPFCGGARSPLRPSGWACGRMPAT